MNRQGGNPPEANPQAARLPECEALGFQSESGLGFYGGRALAIEVETEEGTHARASLLITVS